MNNILNIKRFGLVFRKDFLENWKRYTLLFLTMLGIITVMITWNYLDHYYDVEKVGEQYANSNINRKILSYASLLFGGFGLIFASTFASPMNNKFKKITYLVSPSSNVEKYLSRWIIITIGYIISFFIAFWIADFLRVGICLARYPELEITFLDLTKLINLNGKWPFSEYAFNRPLFMISVSIYLLLQSFFILGATFWEKNSFIKTFTAGALIVLSYVLICRWAILIFYKDFNGFGNVLNSFSFFNNRDFDEETSFIIMSSIISLFTIANWTLAFFRFRESEITKRL